MLNYMKRLKSLWNSSIINFGLFLITLSVGIFASALFLFKSSSPTITPIEIKQIAENQPAQEFQINNNFSNQTETQSQVETPKIVQSEVVNFPVNGRVIVESVEEIGKFPQMVFRSEKTGKVLLRSSIEDEDKWLIPVNDNELSQPALRFRTIKSKGFKSPMIMSVGIYHGGSDNAFYITVFGEIDEKISLLNEKPLFTNIQGGYYLGYLSEKFGYGLAVWCFDWNDAGGHYDLHKYHIEIYQIKNGKFKQIIKKLSKKTYNCDKGFNSLRELGIKATDQRVGIPKIKDYLE